MSFGAPLGAETLRTLRLRGIHTAAHPDARKRRNFPSQAWALLHSFTDFTPHGRAAPRCSPAHAPSEVLSPSASCQSRGATYPRRDPNPPVMLRPQGFAPSRRFAPPATCRACFIPVPLLGFPFEAFPTPCRTPFRAPDPSGFWLGPFGPRLPFRDRAHCADPARGPGV
jgi:hypothetical protein